MRLGVIADDFTGASDIANTLARGHAGSGGLAATLFLGVPDEPADAGCEAGVVALKSRSIPAAEAVARSLAALAWLRAQGARQIVFKVCSTFDSTPRGNIGPVAEALADALGAGREAAVPVCPAFPATGRTVYQGHLFVGDRLLSESGLERHPLNPMTDPDLRRWLRRQTAGEVGLVPRATVARGAAAVRAGLKACAARGERLAVADAVEDADLVTLGEAAAGLPLLVGGSGIALGLPRLHGAAAGAGTPFAGVPGPGAILSGSCSRATLAQVEAHRAAHPSLKVPVGAVMAGGFGPMDVAGFALAHPEDAPLIYASAAPDEVALEQSRFGAAAVAERLDALFAAAARALVAHGARRLVVAGGETSGAVASALGRGALALGPEIDPGVPALVAQGEPPLALALKSGNFGAPDFFARALRVLGGAR